MKRKIIPRLFRFLLFFTLSFIWCRYYINSIYATLTISIIFSFVLDIILNFISKKREGKQNLKNEEIKKAENYSNKFIFSQPNYAINFYFNLAQKRHNAKKLKNGVLIEHKDTKILIYPYYRITNFNSENFVDSYNYAKKNKANKLIICANEFEKNIEKLASSLDINVVFLNKYDAYKKLMKEYNYFPEELSLKEIKTTFKSLIEHGLNKKRMKGYLISAFILIFSSFIVKFNIYYLIMSSILIILALFSYFNPKFNKKIPDQILD